MERDFDIEMEDAEAFAVQATEPEDILPVDDAQEPGELLDDVPAASDLTTDASTVVPNKVHLRGLDTLNPDDIKSYFSEHSGGARFDRIEWVDDSSANLLFGSESSAAEAVAFLSAIELADPTQLPPLELVPAKSFTKKPDVSLQVRFAVAGDRKAAGAASRSRFYLLNPEYDPEERRRNGDFRHRGRYRDREGDRDYDRRYRRNGRRDDRYEEDEPEKFDESLYDDDAAALAKRAELGPRRRRRYSASRSDSRSRSRPRSGNSDSDRRARPDNSGKELFPDIGSKRGRDAGGSRMRDRSASPVRSRDDGRDVKMDGHHGFGADEGEPSSAKNRDKARVIKDRLSKRGENSSKELFPSKLPSSAAGDATDVNVGGKAQMDLFVDKVDLVSKSLNDRITPRNASAPPDDSGSTFNIRGIAKHLGDARGSGGISIKGRATAKELFPEKLGNAGKELFADRLEGRGRPRRKAEDLFH